MRLFHRYILVFGALSSVFASSSFAAREKAVVSKYVDGDSFYARLEDGKTVQIRMIGADTPEAYGKNPKENQKMHATAASDFFKSVLKPDTEFEVESTPRKSHDRILGWVYVDGKDLGLMEVQEGLALPYMYCDAAVCKDKGYSTFLNTHNVKEYLASCEKARKDGIGIWNEADPKKGNLQMIPQEYRRTTLGKNEKTRYIIGSFSKQVFIAKGEKDYTEKTLGIDYCDRVLFDTVKDAEEAGYKKVKAPVR